MRSWGIITLIFGIAAGAQSATEQNQLFADEIDSQAVVHSFAEIASLRRELYELTLAHQLDCQRRIEELASIGCASPREQEEIRHRVIALQRMRKLSQQWEQTVKALDEPSSDRINPPIDIHQKNSTEIPCASVIVDHLQRKLSRLEAAGFRETVEGRETIQLLNIARTRVKLLKALAITESLRERFETESADAEVPAEYRHLWAKNGLAQTNHQRDAVRLMMQLSQWRLDKLTELAQTGHSTPLEVINQQAALRAFTNWEASLSHQQKTLQVQLSALAPASPTDAEFVFTTNPVLALEPSECGKLTPRQLWQTLLVQESVLSAKCEEELLQSRGRLLKWKQQQLSNLPRSAYSPGEWNSVKAESQILSSLTSVHQKRIESLHSMTTLLSKSDAPILNLPSLPTETLISRVLPALETRGTSANPFVLEARHWQGLKLQSLIASVPDSGIETEEFPALSKQVHLAKFHWKKYQQQIALNNPSPTSRISVQQASSDAESYEVLEKRKRVDATKQLHKLGHASVQEVEDARLQLKLAEIRNQEETSTAGK